MNHLSFLSPSEEQHRRAQGQSHGQVKERTVQPAFAPPADRRRAEQREQIDRREGEQTRPRVLGKVSKEIRTVHHDSRRHVHTVSEKNAVNANRTDQNVEESQVDHGEDRDEVLVLLQLFQRHRRLRKGLGDAVQGQKEQINAIEAKQRRAGSTGQRRAPVDAQGQFSVRNAEGQHQQRENDHETKKITEEVQSVEGHRLLFAR